MLLLRAFGEDLDGAAVFYGVYSLSWCIDGVGDFLESPIGWLSAWGRWVTWHGNL